MYLVWPIIILAESYHFLKRYLSTVVQPSTMDARRDSSQEERRDTAKEAAARFDYVRFTFVDIHGIARSRVVPAASLDGAYRNGISVFASK